MLDMHEVTGSSPVPPTHEKPPSYKGSGAFLLCFSCLESVHLPRIYCVEIPQYCFGAECNRFSVWHAASFRMLGGRAHHIQVRRILRVLMSFD